MKEMPPKSLLELDVKHLAYFIPAWIFPLFLIVGMNFHVLEEALMAVYLVCFGISVVPFLDKKITAGQWFALGLGGSIIAFIVCIPFSWVVIALHSKG